MIMKLPRLFGYVKTRRESHSDKRIDAVLLDNTDIIGRQLLTTKQLLIDLIKIGMLTP